MDQEDFRIAFNKLCQENNINGKVLPGAPHGYGWDSIIETFNTLVKRAKGHNSRSEIMCSFERNHLIVRFSHAKFKLIINDPGEIKIISSITLDEDKEK